jgi:hypothetical protein
MYSSDVLQMFVRTKKRVHFSLFRAGACARRMGSYP